MLKHLLYRGYTNGLKVAAYVLPLPKPTLFSGPGSIHELTELSPISDSKSYCSLPTKG